MIPVKDDLEIILHIMQIINTIFNKRIKGWIKGVWLAILGKSIDNGSKNKIIKIDFIKSETYESD